MRWSASPAPSGASTQTSTLPSIAPTVRYWCGTGTGLTVSTRLCGSCRRTQACSLSGSGAARCTSSTRAKPARSPTVNQPVPAARCPTAPCRLQPHRLCSVLLPLPGLRAERGAGTGELCSGTAARREAREVHSGAVCSLWYRLPGALGALCWHWELAAPACPVAGVSCSACG